MKCRNGFVSNSSSSSFIIALRGKECSECYLQTSTLINLVECSRYAEVVSDNKESLLRTLWASGLINDKIKLVSECPHEVVELEIEHHATGIRDVLKALENSGQIEIIDQEVG